MTRAGGIGTLLAAAALVVATACAQEGAPGAGAVAASTEEGGRPMRVVRNETAVDVVVGEAIDLVVARPVGIPEQLQCEWPAAPRVEGAAVRFVRRRIEAPPQDDDGGVATIHYELEAAGAGASRVTLEPKAAGPGAQCRDVTVEVTVREDATP